MTISSTTRTLTALKKRTRLYINKINSEGGDVPNSLLDFYEHLCGLSIYWHIYTLEVESLMKGKET